MRNVLLIFLLSQLLGCAAFIERQLTRVKYPSKLQPIVLQYFMQKQQFCYEGAPAASRDCLSFFIIDIGEKADSGSFYAKMSYEFDTDGKKVSLIDEITFDVTAPAKSAPLAVIFPGYSMHAADMMLYASWLNDIGFFPIIAEGPTFQQPFDFGQRYAGLLAKAVNERYPDRPVLLVGYSMGATSLEPFINHHSQVLGAIAIAPMQDFKEAGLLLFEHARKNHKLLGLVSQASMDRALNNILQSSTLTAEQLNFKYSAQRFKKPLLVFSGEWDRIAPSAGLPSAAFTHIKLPYTDHTMLFHPWPEIRSQTEQWIAAEQLPFQLIRKDKPQPNEIDGDQATSQ